MSYVQQTDIWWPCKSNNGPDTLSAQSITFVCPVNDIVLVIQILKNNKVWGANHLTLGEGIAILGAKMFHN